MEGVPAIDEAASKMDTIYRTQRHIYDVTRKYYLLGRDELISGLDVPEGGTVLEVACGTGRNLIAAARRYPAARFYGFDISHQMLETARENIARAGLSDRVQISWGDASMFTGEALFGVDRFDRVFISYALSMIPPWQAALRQGLFATRNGGSLHIVDFGEQVRLPRSFRAVLRAWLRKFSVEPREDLEDELLRLAEETGSTLKLSRLYRDYARLAVMTRTGEVSRQPLK